MIWPYIAIFLAITAGIIFHDCRLDRSQSPDGYGPIHSAKAAAHDRRWRLYFSMVIVALILLAGLRFRIGMDSVAISDTFDKAPAHLSDIFVSGRLPKNTGKHILLFTLCKQLGLGLWAPQLICAIMLNIPVGILIVRLSRRWFVALLFYLIFAWIQLNFEVMLFGAAAGMLLWALPDAVPSLRGFGREEEAVTSRDLISFTLKILVGAFFHTSVLLMMWLPLLRLKSWQRWIDFGYRWLIMALAGLAATFLIRWVLIKYNYIIGEPSWSDWVTISSQRIAQYRSMLYSPELNLAGWLQALTLKVILPIVVALRLRSLNNESDGHSYAFQGSIMMLIALLGLMGFIMPAFIRLSWYLYPIGCISAANSLSGLRGNGRIAWWMIALAACFWLLYSLHTPARHNRDGHTAELYIPYSSQIEKSYNVRREWIFFVYYQRNVYNIARPDTLLFYEECEIPHDARIAESVFNLPTLPVSGAEFALKSHPSTPADK